MNSRSLPVCTLLSMSLVLLSLPSLSSTNAETNLVDTICKETLNHTKCVEALKSDLRSKYVKNLNDLAKIALGLAISNAKDSLNLINNMTKGAHGADQRVLEKCAFWYKGVVGSFQSALSELDQDVMTSNYDIKIAGDDADNCENEMILSKHEITSVSERNHQVKLYSNIGDVITGKL